MQTIQTDRLTIRNFRLEDWRDLHEMIGQYQASEYAQYDHKWPTSEKEIQDVAKWFSEGDSYFAVCLQTTGKLIGLVAQNRKEREDGLTFGFGYIFNFDFHSQGYATEACQSVLEHAFQQLGAVRMVTGTAAENQPSCRLLARLGFREIDGGEYELSHEKWLAHQKPKGR